MNHDTSKNSPTSPELNAFIQEFEAADMDANQWDYRSRERLDALAKDVLHRTHGVWKRPESVKNALWTRMQECFLQAAQSVKTRDAGYVLTFLPIIFGIHELDPDNPLRPSTSWDLYDMELSLNQLFDGVEAKPFPMLVAEDYLQAADPAMLQQLLRDLISGEDPDPSWNQAHLLPKLQYGASAFFMPVLLRTPGPLPEGWNYMDTLCQGLDTDEEVLEHMCRSLEQQIFHNHDEVEVFCGGVDVVPAVLDLTQTNRDMLFLELQCTSMKDMVTGGDPNVVCDVQSKIILTWSSDNTYVIGRDAVPAIQVYIQARQQGASEACFWKGNISTRGVGSREWSDILRDILANMHNRGWYQTTIVQQTSDTARNEWHARQEQPYLM